jgi:hypothetical protein
MPRREHPHSKVTIKKVSGVIVDCYNEKEWLEQNKQKQAIKKYLYFEKPSLGCFNSDEDYKKEKWKAFKQNYDITKAIKQLLLTAPREEFFSQVMRPANKNKSCPEISPFATEFFKVFLKSKGKYKKPDAKSYLRPYNKKDNILSSWGNDVWNDAMGDSLNLALIDFWNIP